MSTLLHIKNVKKQYFNRGVLEKEALKGVSFEIKQGEVFSLLGANGAGKTTLSSIIASLHPPTSGEVLLHGVSIYNDIINYRRNLGFCAQKQSLSSHMTVREHLEFAGRYFLMNTKDIKARVDELFATFGLGEFAASDPAVLSGGYRQRLLIARAILHKPLLVILDEPTVALDPHVRRQLWDVIKQLKSQGTSVLLTTHYLDEAQVLSDRICLLHAGEVKHIDTPQALMSSYNKANLEDVFLQLMQEESGQ
jgi:ABC-2 type transport system ATP-binding protein